MPIPEHLRMREDDDVEPMEPEAGHDMMEYLDERRDRQAQMRRQRTLAIATGALAVIAAFLAVSNLILLRQVGSPQPVRVVAARPGAAPTSAPPPTQATAPSPPAPSGRAARTAPETPSTPQPQATESEASTSQSTEADDTTRPAMDLPAAPRPSTSRATTEPLRRGEPADAAVSPRTAPMPVPAAPSAAPSDADDPDPARRTARWLVQTYGRGDAESRAASIVDFYSGEERAFWRRVLTAVRSER